MQVLISMTGRRGQQLTRHLFRSGPERVAFLLARHQPGSPVGLNVFDWYPVADSEIEFGDFHLNLVEDVLPRVIKWAWDKEGCLIEAHSHGFDPAGFSTTDLLGLSELVPHVWWRLEGRPYCALVFSPTTFDALAWIDSPKRPESEVLLQAGKGQPKSATGISADSWREDNLD